nr:acetylxylan esterase [Rikenellaceae bacterium]
MEAYLKWAPYFDMAFMLEHNHAKLLFDVGLVDMSVPTASAMVGYNLAAGEKALYTYPFRSHGIPKGKYRSEWDERVFAAIREFILDALK